MPDDTPENQGPSPLELFQQFKAEHPELAQAVEEEVKKTVLSAEQKLGAHQGEAKQQEALSACLSTLYDGADIFFGFPGPVDLLLKQIVIPAIPDLIDYAVDWFHLSGVFGKVD